MNDTNINPKTIGRMMYRKPMRSYQVSKDKPLVFELGSGLDYIEILSILITDGENDSNSIQSKIVKNIDANIKIQLLMDGKVAETNTIGSATFLDGTVPPQVIHYLEGFESGEISGNGKKFPSTHARWNGMNATKESAPQVAQQIEITTDMEFEMITLMIVDLERFNQKK